MSSTAETPLLKPRATRRGPGTLLLGVVVCCAALAGVAVKTSGVADGIALATKVKAPKPTPQPTNVPPPRHKTEDGEVWLETSYVEGGRRKSLEQFGYSFAASSDFLVVGAPNSVTLEYAQAYFSPGLSSYNFTTPPGKVSIYKRTEDDEWEQFGSDLVGEAIGDSFGYSVAVSQTVDMVIVAISAAELDRDICKNMTHYPVEFRDEDQCLEQVPRRGVTRVYWSSPDRPSWGKNGADITYPQTTLRQEYTLRITNDDLLKQSVAMDAEGETIVVAVPVVGKGYIFSNSHLGNPLVPWDFVGEMSGPTARYYIGSATVVAISEDGTMAALGDPKGGSFQADRTWRGFASVYTKTQNTPWLQNIVIEGQMDYAQCGWSLALSDGLPGRPGEKRLAIGCPGRHAGQSERPDYYGPLVIVGSPTDKEEPINWSFGHIEQDDDDQFTEFGRAVAFNADGTQVAVGAPFGGMSYAGRGFLSAAYVGGWAAVFDIEGDNDSYKQVGPRIVSDRSLLGKNVMKWWGKNKPRPFAWYQYLGHGVAFSGDDVVVSAPGDPLTRQVFFDDDDDFYNGGKDQPAQVRDYQLGKPKSDGAAPRVVAALSLVAAVFLAL